MPMTTAAFLLGVVLGAHFAAPTAIFRRTGHMWATKGVVHVAFPVDLSPLHAACEKLRSINFDGIIQSSTTRWTRLQFRLQEAISFDVDRGCAEIESWPLALQRPERSKRQVLLTLLGSVFGAFAIEGITDYFTHDAVDKNMQKIHEEINRMAATFENHIKSLQIKQARESWLMQMAHNAHQFVSTVNRIADAFQTLVADYRVHPALLPFSALPNFWADVFSAFKEDFYFPFPAEAVYELPASFTFSSDRIHIVVHIPWPHMHFDLFTLEPFPVVINDTAFTLTPPSGNFLLAADEHHQSFVLPSFAFLSACLRLGHVHLCDVPILRHDADFDCLAAQFIGHWHQALDQCTVTPFTAPWALAHGGGGEHHLFLRQETAFSLRCRNGSVTSGSWPPGHSLMSWEASCSLTSSLFSRSSREERYLDGETVIVRAFPASINIDAQVEQEREQKALQWHFEHHWTPTSVSAISAVGVVALLLTILVILSLYSLSKIRQASNTTGAPSPFARYPERQTR